MVLGRQIARPDVALRCSSCDRVEAELRGWTRGSGPASPRRAEVSVDDESGPEEQPDHQCPCRPCPNLIEGHRLRFRP
jgi:hypothetical protein